MTRTPTTALTSERQATPRLRSACWPPAAGRSRRSAAWLMALLVAGLAASASAQVENVTFSQQPVASTVVEGHAIAFLVRDNLDPSGNPPPAYQWYRNDVAISGATAAYYRFSALLGDNGARYHVVAQGVSPKGMGGARPLGPTASEQATLTVLPGGSALPPQLTAPTGDTLYLTAGATTNIREFRALGNDVQWAYRFDSEPADQWHVLSADTNGVQAALIDITPPAGGTSITVRVTDDASAGATRTWAIGTNQAPTIVANPMATPNPAAFPGPVMFTASASDPDGDALTYTWVMKQGPAEVTLVPNGTTASSTTRAVFAAAGNYWIGVTISDGRGGIVESSTELVVIPLSHHPADINADGVVNALDLGVVVDAFGITSP